MNFNHRKLECIRILTECQDPQVLALVERVLGISAASKSAPGGSSAPGGEEYPLHLDQDTNELQRSIDEVFFPNQASKDQH